MDTDAAQTAWRDACLSAALFAVDPHHIGGIWLRARPGPARDAYLGQDCLDLRRIHPNIGEDALFGGIDLTATLSAGAVCRKSGLLDEGGCFILTTAERCPARLAAHLGSAIDSGGTSLVAIDEGTDDETPPPALTERLGIFVLLEDIPSAAITGAKYVQDDISRARASLPGITLAARDIDALTIAAARLGIDSLRAPLFAAAVARAHAALRGGDRVSADDLDVAARLTLAHRATIAPMDSGEDAQERPEPSDVSRTDAPSDETTISAEEMLVESARAVLPADILHVLAGNRVSRGARGSAGTGMKKRGNRRGRPLPSERGRIDGGARIDLVATLRAAAPWQTLRRRETGRRGLLMRADDIRIRRFEERSDRLLVFLVDASGSAAMSRLAEAKGAIEILLAEAYARRDHVSLVAFRGEAAETLLPPTRSLVQTKRRLRALPGGGGTPLASGLMTALAACETASRRGMTPTIALLTDGRGNIALDGSAGRDRAMEDAQKAARLIRFARHGSIVIDTAPRPQAPLSSLAEVLGANYHALPRANAESLSAAIRSASTS